MRRLRRKRSNSFVSASYSIAVNNNSSDKIVKSTDDTAAEVMTSDQKTASYSTPSDYLNTKRVTQSTDYNYESLNITETLAIASTRGMPSHYKLAVAGNIIARGVDIKAPAEWPDYVFENDYNLMSLRELRAYIEQYGHLPGFHSAAAMKAKDNYNIAFMDVKLLEKIEELTLHLIKLQKEL